MSISVRSYLLVLTVTAIALWLAHLIINYITYEIEEVPWLLHQLFELDEENNLPTWFSRFLLLNNAIVLALAANTAESHKIHWHILAIGFLALAVDEVAGLHETFHSTIDDNWTIYAAPLILFVGLFFIPFLLKLPKITAFWFILSGSFYVGGALGIEWLAQDMDEETFEYALAVALEEGAEMAGALMFLAVNLARLRSLQPELKLQLH